LIWTEVFIWLTHQKRNKMKIVGATFGIGGALPHYPPWLRTWLLASTKTTTILVHVG